MIKDKHKGCIGELIAISWLLEQGYDVFENVSTHGEADLVAIKNGVITLIDVKGSSDDEGKKKGGQLTPKQKSMNVRCLLVNITTKQCFGFRKYKEERKKNKNLNTINKIFYRMARPKTYKPKAIKTCNYCGNLFWLKNKHKFCSVQCGNKFSEKRRGRVDLVLGCYPVDNKWTTEKYNKYCTRYNA